MKRTLIVTALSLLLTPLSALAETCSKTKYSLLTQDVKFGDTKDVALQALKKAYQGKALVKYEQEKSQITVTFNAKNRDMFDLVFFNVVGGVVTRISWSYSNAFQDKLGGPSDALVSLVKKARDKYGMNDTSNKVDNGFELTWGVDEGASLEIVGRDPYFVSVRIECETLDTEMKEKEAKSTNFGF